MTHPRLFFGTWKKTHPFSCSYFRPGGIQSLRSDSWFDEDLRQRQAGWRCWGRFRGTETSICRIWVNLRWLVIAFSEWSWIIHLIEKTLRLFGSTVSLAFHFFSVWMVHRCDIRCCEALKGITLDMHEGTIMGLLGQTLCWTFEMDLTANQGFLRSWLKNSK